MEPAFFFEELFRPIPNEIEYSISCLDDLCHATYLAQAFEPASDLQSDEIIVIGEPFSG